MPALPASIVLNQLAELVPASDPRRKLLENIDRIAKGAIETVRVYVNKHGEEIEVAQPDWGTALKGMVAGAALLNPDLGKPEGNTVPPVVARILAAVPK